MVARFLKAVRSWHHAMRGLAIEFDLVVPKGMDKLDELVVLVEEDRGIPEQAGEAFVGLREHCRATAGRIGDLERLERLHVGSDRHQARQLLRRIDQGRINWALRYQRHEISTGDVTVQQRRRLEPMDTVRIPMMSAACSGAMSAPDSELMSAGRSE